MPKNIQSLRDIGHGGIMAVLETLSSGKDPENNTPPTGGETAARGPQAFGPARALADLAFFMSGAVPDAGRQAAIKGPNSPLQADIPALAALRLAWIGGSNGLAEALIEAAMYLPFELFMALPEWGEPNRDKLGLALSAGAKIFLTRDPAMAVEGARYVYAGVERNPDSSPAGEISPAMVVTEKLMALAAPEAVLLPGVEKNEAARLPEDMMRIYVRARAAIRI